MLMPEKTAAGGIFPIGGPVHIERIHDMKISAVSGR